MMKGYAYCLERGSNWRAAPDDDWETVVFTPKGKPKFEGFRTIDGVRCTVWKVERRGVAPAYYAQSEASAPAPKGIR
jgi:transposase